LPKTNPEQLDRAIQRPRRTRWLVPVALAALAVGCGGTPDQARDPGPAAASAVTAQGELTRAIDQMDRPIADLRAAQSQSPAGDAQAVEQRNQARLALYVRRWKLIQRAATHHGTVHRDAFYGSRAYWHTQSSRGLGFALDEPGDLNEPFYVAGRGNVRVAGDVNADIEVAGSAIVHILGDLNATLELEGVSVVIVAGRITDKGSVMCKGQVELYCGGDLAGSLRATRSATYIIDGNATGSIQCSVPATQVTVTGDLSATIAAPEAGQGVLTLRVDVYAPTDAMLDLQFADFVRVNATIGRSNVPPGLYPEHTDSTRPVARWVVLQQKSNDQ